MDDGSNSAPAAKPAFPRKVLLFIFPDLVVVIFGLEKKGIQQGPRRGTQVTRFFLLVACKDRIQFSSDTTILDALWGIPSEFDTN